MHVCTKWIIHGYRRCTLRFVCILGQTRGSTTEFSPPRVLSPTGKVDRLYYPDDHSHQSTHCTRPVRLNMYIDRHTEDCERSVARVMIQSKPASLAES